MTEVIDRIFAELKAEIEKGKNIEPPKFPELKDELVPFIVQELTPEEREFLIVRVQDSLTARKLYQKLELMAALNLLDQVEETEKEVELIRLHDEMLEDLLFWYFQEKTGWKYSTLIQGLHDGKVVLVGLTQEQTRELIKQQEAEDQMAQTPISNVVN